MPSNRRSVAEILALHPRMRESGVRWTMRDSLHDMEVSPQHRAAVFREIGQTTKEALMAHLYEEAVGLAALPQAKTITAPPIDGETVRERYPRLLESPVVRQFFEEEIARIEKEGRRLGAMSLADIAYENACGIVDSGSGSWAMQDGRFIPYDDARY